MEMKVARTRFAKVNGRLCITGMLRAIGVPESMLWSELRRRSTQKSFWSRSINHLAILETARNLYRKRIARCHPDKPKGCSKTAAYLNGLWKRIESAFRQHNYELA